MRIHQKSSVISTGALAVLAALAVGAGTASAANLLGFYTMEDTTNDVSGAGANPTHTGTNVGGFVAGGFEGKALDFTGSGLDGLTVPINIQDPNVTTVGGWVRFDSVSDDALFGTDDGGWDRGLVARNDLFMHGDQNTGITPTTGSWNFFAAVFDGTGNGTLYWNSSTASFGPTAVNSGGVTSLSWGDYDQVGTDNWSLDGQMDNLFVFDAALTPTEIQTIIDNGASGVLQVGGIPEPSSMMLLLGGFVAFALRRRRRV